LAEDCAWGCWAFPYRGAALTPSLGFDVTWLQGRAWAVSSPRMQTCTGSPATWRVAGLPLARLILEVGGIVLCRSAGPASTWMGSGPSVDRRPSVQTLGGLPGGSTD